ncbi:GrpB family protein [Melghirimyces algeriensis]|uniref:GrpB domain, predicted nucleotidyltransferase, UPF0157 family n=1 Tax=Melghirimyces algeriensis TaxID=910412 RepID=A0A521BD01_9BACL|nr:GrpB family protein [Melghirimyces algeriensis]SMO44929.1 GrpB domain, predicted nucleotidyltransferase, UPF0157 family [Melghirimyces algeriensis]
MQKVTIVPYQPEWPQRFEREAEWWSRLLGDNLVAIHHIGSTSVPGLSAKPIIDMMPVVQDLGEVDACNDAVQEYGYEPKGEWGISGRRFFYKGGEDRTHHVHVFKQGSPDVHRHLAFRDYLRAHPDIADQYGSLKQRLARDYPTDIIAYMDGKDPFIKGVEQKALRWATQSRWMITMPLPGVQSLPGSDAK